MLEVSAVRAPEAVYRGVLYLSLHHQATAEASHPPAILHRTGKTVTKRGETTLQEKSGRPDKPQQTEKVRVHHYSCKYLCVKNYQSSYQVFLIFPVQ